MKTEQFFYVLEIADTGSFSQAARNLFISQPNLSHAVKQIEKEIGFPIFHRSSSGVIPTQKGRQLIDHFRIMKREYDQVQDIILLASQRPRLSLRVATLDFGRSTPVFSAIINRYIGSPIDFSFLNYSCLDDLLLMVETCQVDFAIIGTLSPYHKTSLERFRNRAIEYHAFAEVPICALVGPNNPLYHGPDTIPLERLYPYTIIQHSSATEDPSYSIPLATGLSPHVYGEVHVNSSHLFYHTIQSTPAVGLVAYTPSSFRQQGMWKDIHILNISDCDVMARFGWIKLQRMPLTDIAADLLHDLEELF